MRRTIQLLIAAVAVQALVAVAGSSPYRWSAPSPVSLLFPPTVQEQEGRETLVLDEKESLS